MSMEQVIPLPDGGEWIVQAYAFSPAEAEAEFKRIEKGSRGKGENFSIWRTMYPDKPEMHMIVLCARREHLPRILGGDPVEIDMGNARAFALRRAKTGVDGAPDALAHGETTVEQRMHYGVDTPVIVDPATGDVKPYSRRRE